MRKILQIVFICFAFIPCYGQSKCDCDYKTSDTLFLNHILRLNEVEWDEVKKISREVIKDTLNLDSLVLIYYENGNIYTRIPYKNGKQCGYYEQYYSTGQLAKREYRINDKAIDGYYYFYAIDGSISEEGRYKNGIPIGDWFIYTFRKKSKKYTYSKKGKLKNVKTWNENKNRWELTDFHMEIIETDTQIYEIIY